MTREEQDQLCRLQYQAQNEKATADAEKQNRDKDQKNAAITEKAILMISEAETYSRINIAKAVYAYFGGEFRGNRQGF